MLELSLVPGHFQEANYDNIHRGGQNEANGHLIQSFEFDCMFYKNGKTRSDLSLKEFEDYKIFSDRAIKAALNQYRRNLWLCLLIMSMRT